MNFFLFCKLLHSSWLCHFFISMSCCLADVLPTLSHWKLMRCVLGAGTLHTAYGHMSVLDVWLPAVRWSGAHWLCAQFSTFFLTNLKSHHVLSVFCWELAPQIFIHFFSVKGEFPSQFRCTALKETYQVWYLAGQQLLVWIQGCPGTKMSNKVVP